VAPGPDSAEGAASPGLTSWWVGHEKPLHPLTPRVAVGVKNNSTVAFVVADPTIALALRTLVTAVTDPDATNAGMPASDLAEH